jgi:hypothetical protein
MADSNEDRLLRSALGRTAECVPVERLESLDPQARAHVERCTYCQNELAMLMQFRDAAPTAEEAPSVAWIQSELERRSAATPQVLPSTSLWSKTGAWLKRALPARGWQAVPVAAGLLIMVAGGMYLRKTDQGLQPPVGEPVWRSQSFAAIAPLGDVGSAPAELQWDAAPGASKYLVRLTEVDRTEIWRGETAGTRIALPAEVRRQMIAGRSFLWAVTARDGAGRTLAETSLQTFHILVTSH